MSQPIDIFITSYLRSHYTRETINYLYERTTYPFRLFIIDNGGNDSVIHEGIQNGKIFLAIRPTANMGIHAAWNTALALAESEYFITSDNDIWVPDLRKSMEIEYDDGKRKLIREDETNIQLNEPCWLGRMVRYMNERPDYGAISLHPHIFIGAAGIDPNHPEDVIERNMCGAVMRIMRTEVVRKAGGWEHVVRSSRNHEERTICSRLQTLGYKVGVATRVRAYHPFGKDLGGNWGYPQEVTPEMQGHNPALRDEVLRFDNIEAYDQKTWLPK